MKFMARGAALVECCKEGDLESFQKIFEDAKDMHDLMFWHIQKAFKEAVKYKCMPIIHYLIEDVEIDLKHPTFNGFFHLFLFSCQKAERENDEDERELNR